ncbi:T9SS type B sorting domain-containing protein [Flavobacterium sp.]|uniref:T9SS type B sorting domain-containing protein n=1 Tax=Flavobacterium sp. TaxID=239 RepID=UPI0039E43650
MPNNIIIAINLILLLAAGNASSQAVSSCENSDFEAGNFNGWKGETGTCCPVVTAPSGIVPGRHTIMSGNGTDPNTCDNVHVVAPGGLYSARVGNAQIGAEAEKLTYSITVSPSSALFIYKYAVVLEDPGHPAIEQPRFQIRVVDAMGQLIDPVCGEYTVVASSSLPGFHNCNGIVYKDWTTVGLDLSAYMGQTLSIEFVTGDCTPGGHFGYAYVDAYCSPLQISSTYCSGSLHALLTAPIGFEYLWNTGETTQSINVNNPVGGQTYTCQLRSVTGCIVNISTVLSIADPIADFAIANTCYDNAQFSNTSVAPPHTVLDTFMWDFGDGTTSTEENPRHTFPSVGTYNVSFSISNGIGCASIVNHNVTVFPAPTAAISYPQSPYCTAILSAVPVILTGTNDYLGGTFSSTVGLAINPTTGAILPRSSLPGTYTVTYAIPTTADNCTVPAVTTTVTITAVPMADIRYPDAAYCKDITSVPALLTGTNAYFGGVYNAPFGLAIDGVTGTIDPSKSAAGTYTVTYATPASAGCDSVKATTTITINALPDPQLADGYICVDAEGNTFWNYTLETGLNASDYSFEWYRDTARMASETGNAYEADQIGTYSVVATNIHTGCRSPEVSAEVRQAFTPDNFIAYLGNDFSDNPSLTLIVQGGTGPYLFSIDNGPFEYGNVYTNLSPGTHTIKVTDANQCTDLAKEILILDYPKFFTPNNDGYHDTWNIFRLSNQPNARIYIYDRYGKLLKQISPAEQGWDGSYNGKPMPSEDYWFSVDYQEMDLHGLPEWRKYKSHFSIKR